MTTTGKCDCWSWPRCPRNTFADIIDETYIHSHTCFCVQVEEFKRVSKFRIFNTNNLWMSMTAMKELVETQAIHMEVIENKKVLIRLLPCNDCILTPLPRL